MGTKPVSLHVFARHAVVLRIASELRSAPVGRSLPHRLLECPILHAASAGSYMRGVSLMAMWSAAKSYPNSSLLVDVSTIALAMIDIYQYAKVS